MEMIVSMGIVFLSCIAMCGVFYQGCDNTEKTSRYKECITKNPHEKCVELTK